MSMCLGASWKGEIFSPRVAVFQVLVSYFLLPWGWFINHLEMFATEQQMHFSEQQPPPWSPSQSQAIRERTWEVASPCLPKPTIWEVNELPAAFPWERTQHRRPARPAPGMFGCLFAYHPSGGRRMVFSCTLFAWGVQLSLKLIYLTKCPRKTWCFFQGFCQKLFPWWEIPVFLTWLKWLYNMYIWERPSFWDILEWCASRHRLSLGES